MLHLLIHLVHLINKIIEHGQKNQPEPQLDSSLYKRKSISILQYIKIATDAMINEGKKGNDVKNLLLEKGLHEDHVDVVIEKAEAEHKKWFNETGGKPSPTVFQTYEQLIQKAQSNRYAVDVTTTTEEDHAVHFCGLIGFKNYYQASGRNTLYGITNLALTNAPVMTNGETAIKQSTFARLGGGQNNPYLRVVTINGQREVVFPYLQTESKIHFQTQQIIEWSNHDALEAEVDGSWNRDFKICFFATDYAVNKHIYKSQSKINVKLSAFIVDLFLFSRDSTNKEVTNASIGFKPDKNYTHKSYFNFVALILEIKGAPVDRLSIGGIIRLKLTGNKLLPGNDLIIDAYVTNNNIKAENIQKDMLVSGTLWFQGEIAS